MHVGSRAAALSLALLFLSSRARSEDRIQECIDAHTAGQRSEQDGALKTAEEHYLRCSQRLCPPLVQKDCSSFRERVSGAIPSLLVRATIDGVETARVRLIVDGVVAEGTLSGRSVTVDPGERRIAVDFGARGVVEQRVVFRQNEKDRGLAFAAPAPAPRPPSKPTPPVLAYVLGAVAVAGGASFAFFGLRGLDKESALESSCGPPCTERDLQPIHRDYLIADISLGIGLVSAGVATWLLLRGAAEGSR